jgi:hypothetical protein
MADMLRKKLLPAFFLLALDLASCGANRAGENNAVRPSSAESFVIEGDRDI